MCKILLPPRQRRVFSSGGRSGALVSIACRDAGLDTVWQVEHLLKGPEDADTFLELPDEVFAFEPDVSTVLKKEEALGNRGLVMVDTEDPLCAAAALFSMEDYLRVMCQLQTKSGLMSCQSQSTLPCSTYRQGLRFLSSSLHTLESQHLWIY